MSKLTLLCLNAFFTYVVSQVVFSEYFQLVDEQLGYLNHRTADLSWRAATFPQPEDFEKTKKLNEFRSEWKKDTCTKLSRHFPNAIFREINMICRGPFYSKDETRQLSFILSRLRQIYQEAQVCIEGICYHIEPDLVRLMSQVRDPEILKQVWVSWRDEVGYKSKELYIELIQLMNSAARRNGYEDMGEIWREEFEIDNLEEYFEELMKEVMPIYEKLHAVVRFKLRTFYGSHVPQFGPLPAHILGNMWGQSWENIFDIIYDGTDPIDIGKELQKKNYTVKDLVEKSEEFYESIGLRPMTEEFWKNSKFDNVGGTCHGTAVNMFEKNDYRMILCGRINEEDLHVIIHEMGHIQYFMAYEDQLNVFKDGASSAMHEAVGEAVAMAFSTAQNIRRLLNIENKHDDLEFQLHLRQGLRILPQIPFSLIMDKWRWAVFKEDVKPEEYNSFWWQLRKQYQGIAPPQERNENSFDPASKFHIIDNIPYARYFLATFLQVQIYEAMCQQSTGPKAQNIPLYRCDLSDKGATNSLKYMMEKGSSINFTTGVLLSTNKPLTTTSLKTFFEPLVHWLDEQIILYDIPIGW